MRLRFNFTGKESIRIYPLIFLYLLLVVLFVIERSYDRERGSLTGRYREFISLADEYRKIKESDLMVTMDQTMTSEGLLQRINSLVDKMGLKERVKFIRTTGSREIKELTEEGIDMRIDKLTMNEMINLLHWIENQGLSIKDIRMKKDFERSERINLEIKFFMYKRK